MNILKKNLLIKALGITADLVEEYLTFAKQNRDDFRISELFQPDWIVCPDCGYPKHVNSVCANPRCERPAELDIEEPLSVEQNGEVLNRVVQTIVVNPEGFVEVDEAIENKDFDKSVDYHLARLELDSNKTSVHAIKTGKRYKENPAFNNLDLSAHMTPCEPAGTCDKLKAYKMDYLVYKEARKEHYKEQAKIEGKIAFYTKSKDKEQIKIHTRELNALMFSAPRPPKKPCGSCKSVYFEPAKTVALVR